MKTVPMIFFIAMTIAALIAFGAGFEISKKMPITEEQLSRVSDEALRKEYTKRSDDSLKKMFGTNQSPENQETAKIINTLRNYKSAALMYYTEKSAWPNGMNIQDILDTYADYPLDRKDFAMVQTVSAGKNRVLIGLVAATGSPLAQPQIQARLESQAKSSNLYAADGTPYVLGTAAVYMLMR